MLCFGVESSFHSMMSSHLLK